MSITSGPRSDKDGRLSFRLALQRECDAPWRLSHRCESLSHAAESPRSTGQISVGERGTERLTETGVLMGTPLYMAPEAVDGARDATQAVDVFAFGVIAYEILAGHVPFRDSPALTLAEGKSIPLPVPLTTECPNAPVAIARFIERCLSFSPEQRPTAKEAHEVLARI